jgi:hypothetical protein
MLNEREQEIFDKISKGIEPETPNLPIFLRVPGIVENFSELTDAVCVNHSLGLISDKQQEDALSYIESLMHANRPEAELAEVGYAEADDGSGEMILMIPRSEKKE